MLQVMGHGNRNGIYKQSYIFAGHRVHRSPKHIQGRVSAHGNVGLMEQSCFLNLCPWVAAKGWQQGEHSLPGGNTCVEHRISHSSSSSRPGSLLRTEI